MSEQRDYRRIDGGRLACPACGRWGPLLLVLGDLFASPTSPCVKCRNCGIEWMVQLRKYSIDAEEPPE